MLSRLRNVPLAAARAASSARTGRPTRAIAAVPVQGWRAQAPVVVLSPFAMGSLATARRYSTAPTDAAATTATEAAVASVENASRFSIPSFTDAFADLGTHAVRGELTAAGLGNYTPVGAIQNTLELLSSVTHLPWWASIALTTLVVKSALLPLVIRSARNSVLLANIAPEMEKHTTKIKAFQKIGDRDRVLLETAKLKEVLDKSGANPLMSFTLPIIQGPIFISFFLALRSMATAPLESMKAGGMLWFHDLTVADPYYILPVLSTAFTFTLIHNTLKQMPNTSQKPFLAMIMRGISLITLPIAATLPTANLVYWVIANGFTLSQQTLVTSKVGARWFDIPERIVHTPSSAEATTVRSFVKDVKDGFNSVMKFHQERSQDNEATKAAREKMESREKQLDAMRMGKGSKATKR